MQDIRRFHEAFYSNKTKVDQDNFILKHTSQSKPKRQRSIKGTRSGNTVSVQYCIKTKKGLVSVCNKAFVNILGISKFRVQRLNRNFLTTGLSAKENRGGDRRSGPLLFKKAKVTDFIKGLKCIESHYGRNKSIRQYLPSDCSIRKLWRVYCRDNSDHKVKYDYFRKIFVTDFNISFKSPATDACSECIRLKGLAKLTNSSPAKVELLINLRIHKLKAKAFYSMLQAPEENTLKISFDCQKNMVLPRVPDQSAYYSRQLYLYNFCIVEGHSKGPQPKQSVTAYTWSENQRYKGSNEIASMIYDKLSSLDLTDIKFLKLFADGCPGQNKNVTVMGMLMYWLHCTLTQVQQIDVIFPVVGHSFLPPDRVFGRIEKVVKRKDTIISPGEYREIFSEFSTVKILGNDFKVFDWQKAVKSTIQPPGKWHFKFSLAKRFTIQKIRLNGKISIKMKGEVSYKSDTGMFKSVVKKGWQLANMEIEELPENVPVQAAKLVDVNNLLTKHFGNEWRNLSVDNLSYYRNVLDSEIDNNEQNTNQNEEEEELFIEEDLNSI